MRPLIQKFVFMEPKPGYYSHTRMSWILRRPNMADIFQVRLDEVFRSSSRVADALAATGYQEPSRGAKSGFQLAFDTKHDFWKHITEVEPLRSQRFAQAMRAVPFNSLEILPELYPFDTLAVDGGLIVDVGGGLGHVSKTILSRYPDVALKCVVQDYQVQCDLTAGLAIEFQQYDFFEPQPVKGAAAYFFRHIFHDWPDDACAAILKHTAEAMDVKRSRILICDQVMDDNSPSEASVLYDIDMMTLFGGKERRLQDWGELITSADRRLRISNVFRSPRSEAALIEVRLT
ncbi:hypothetical protein CNMCM5623_002230 [Aspergillus felis]|uniref:O-methyltransferase C-terminal domain-containing protein n=1 Tax=Aspergillus felis TaxID=1287682 RepID=A0A8H6UWG0_9EURO|nr:hypothetical protein CNMCM5623_002230 [Aspergillus felis]